MVSENKLNPHWMTETFFEKILRSSEGDKNIKVSDFKGNLASKSADNYSSTIFRVTVTFSMKSGKIDKKRLIIKILSLKTNALANDNSFNTELKMYSTILPEMERLLQFGGEIVKLAPRLLYSSNEPVPVLVFEDLCQFGFEMVNEPLNFEETKVVISKLAKWHAASIYMEKDYQDVCDIETGLFNLQSEGLNFMLDNMNVFKEEIKSWNGFEKYTEKLETLAKNFHQKGKEVFRPNSPGYGFNVLNHGDFHYKNMLFRRSEGKISDAIFLDFQFTVWATPAIDLFYTLYMVASPSTREICREEIMGFYHKELLETLDKIGLLSKAPSLLELNVELLRHGYLEVVIAICFLPFLFVNQNDPKAENLLESSKDSVDFRKKIFAAPQYVKIISQLLPEFLFKGLLD